jgi:hypothetical protein
MTLNIIPKKPFTDYTEAEQQEILSRGQAILAQKLEQGESRSQEDTWCMLAYQRTQREVRFKPIVKEKPLTKAQKLELLNESIALQEEQLSDKHKLVLEELVGLDKEYYVFILSDGSKELMKMTKTNIKKKVTALSEIDFSKPLELDDGDGFVPVTLLTKLKDGTVKVACSPTRETYLEKEDLKYLRNVGKVLTTSEQEFLTAMTGEMK